MAGQLKEPWTLADVAARTRWGQEEMPALAEAFVRRIKDAESWDAESWTNVMIAERMIRILNGTPLPVHYDEEHETVWESLTRWHRTQGAEGKLVGWAYEHRGLSFAREFAYALSQLRDQLAKEAAPVSGAEIQQVVDALLRQLDDPDSRSTRELAARALGQLGEWGATEAVARALVRRLDDEDSEVRRVGAEALGTLGAKVATQQVADALRYRLEDNEPSVRWFAAEALVRLGCGAASDRIAKQPADWMRDCEKDRVAKELVDWLGNDSAERVERLCVSLAKLGSFPARVQPAVQAWVGRLCSSDLRKITQNWFISRGHPPDNAGRNLQALANQGVRVFVAAPQASDAVPVVTAVKSVEELSA